MSNGKRKRVKFYDTLYDTILFQKPIYLQQSDFHSDCQAYEASQKVSSFCVSREKSILYGHYNCKEI